MTSKPASSSSAPSCISSSSSFKSKSSPASGRSSNFSTWVVSTVVVTSAATSSDVSWPREMDGLTKCAAEAFVTSVSATAVADLDDWETMVDAESSVLLCKEATPTLLADYW